MINFDFDYYRPESIEEAVQTMQVFLDQKKTCLYYSGGTEIVSNFRKGKSKADAVIDLKGIKDMCGIEESKDAISIGAATPLNQIIEYTGLEDLAVVLKCIADHTIRNTLTLGGNICGKLPYKEGILPLLAVNAQLVIAGSTGLKTVDIGDVFKNRLLLDETEFVCKINWPKVKNAQVYTQRETMGIDVDYPILHLYGRITEKQLFVGLSGFAAYPVYRFFTDDDAGDLNTFEAKHQRILSAFQSQARGDERGSTDYRVHLLTQAIKSMLDAFREVHHD